MKNFNLTILSILMVTVFCFNQCKKENSENKEHTPVNITLYNQPLPVIQSYLQGIWRLEYLTGGWGGYQNLHDQNIRWQFTPGDRIVQNYNGVISTDTTITWIRDKGVFTGPDSTFLMKFYDKRGYPYIYVVHGIINDSLVLHEDGSDGQYYHFSRSN